MYIIIVSVRTTVKEGAKHVQEISILVYLEPISRPQPAILHECLPRGLLVIIVPHCNVSTTEVQLAHLVDIGLRTVLANDTCFLPRHEDASTFDDTRTLGDTLHLADGGNCLREKGRREEC
jgi:hypothetical protein